MPDTPRIDIREVSAEEYLDTGLPIGQYAFGASPREPDRDKARRNLPYYEHTHSYVGRVDGTPQAAFVSYEMTQNVRGAVLPMGGIGGVASMPAGRRRGIVRRMFEQVFVAYRDAGVPVATLYPFRDSFYERLGYAGFPHARYLTLKPSSLATLVRQPIPGTCEQVLIRDGFDDWRAFLERYQHETHGFALKARSNAVQTRDENAWWLALARHEGEIVGAMQFRITGYEERLIADTFYAVNSVGRYLLLDWVGRHTDQVKEAVIELRPDDYPELWFRDLEATISTRSDQSWPGPMGRVIDVRGLTGIGAGPGELVLELDDHLAPWNSGRFRFRGVDGTLMVEPTDDAPGACLTIQGLSALVFTGHDPADFAFRGWGESDPDASETLRSLFPPVVPDIHEKF